ncbi:MAG: flagellar hook-associated protein FlgK [Syntrophomonadaceae bacterium]|nr:flagellar hook-associated protein FlgK [Syntrophomonadaceae bacterium]
MSLFGMEIGKRSIMAQQTALEVTGHNMANANTPGYTRQIPNLVTTIPYHTPALTNSNKAGQLGTGVKVADIERIRDVFLDQQIRNEAKTAGYWDSIHDALAKMEVILNEPSSDGLRAVMDMYWESWQDLTAYPESEAVRSTVAQRGLALADAFNHMHKQLTELREDLNASVEIKVNEINTITKQISDLNAQILNIQIAGKQPNDLEDKRDLLLDQLSQIIDIKTFTDHNGMVAVQLGGRTLVQGRDYTELTTEQDSQGMHLVIWADTKVRARIESGELRGYLDARGKTNLSQEKDPSEYREIVPNLLDDLNKLAETIIKRTNEIHKTGYNLDINAESLNFYEMPTGANIEWAAIIKVEDAILNDPMKIAAAEDPTFDPDTGEKINFGDSRIAMAIANLKHDYNSVGQVAQSGNLPGLPATISNKHINITYDNTVYNLIIDGDFDNNQQLADAVQAEIDRHRLPITVEMQGDRMVMSSFDKGFESVEWFWGATSDTAPTSGSISDATVDDFWRSVCANIGVRSQESVRMLDNQIVLLSELTNKKEAVSGVNLDEEVINMIKFQHAYNAASRFITTMDEAIDVIVNRMGLVGR